MREEKRFFFDAKADNEIRKSFRERLFILVISNDDGGAKKTRKCGH